MDEPGETRRRSAALFGNEKTVEVVLALADEEGVATAQQLHMSTGIAYSMVRDALNRLVQGGAVRALPKTGHSRSAQYYQPIEGRVWGALVTAAAAIRDEVGIHRASPQPDGVLGEASK